MKKGTSFFYITAAILLLTVSGCKLKVEDSELAPQPEASVGNDITVIVPQLNNDTDYINLYRMDTHDNEIVKVGMLYHPQSIEYTNYLFIDTLAFKNHKYKYRARYHDNTGYHYTEWSNEVKAEADTFLDESTDELKYDVTGVTFTYDIDNYSINISGTITEPDFDDYDADEYKPMLVVSNSGTTQIFPLSAIGDQDSIPLRSVLPYDFQDTEITIIGILSQKDVYKDTERKNLKYTVWTPVTTITVTGTRKNTMTIKSQKGQKGADFT